MEFLNWLGPVATPIGTLLTAVSILLAVITAVRGYTEYVAQNALKRFEKFQEIRRHFKENEEFRHICYLLDTGANEIADVGFKAKRDFLGFFEEVALMHNSKLLNDDIAHYMFGYYAIRCYESDEFWSDVNRGSYYWSLFTSFAIRMKAIEERVVAGRGSVNVAKFVF